MYKLHQPHAVAPALSVASKKALMQALAHAAARAHGLDEGAVLERLIERERLGPTGFGHGTAIPHARLDGLPGIVGVFARLTKGVDYGSVDALPVDLVFLLLSPVDAGAEHLKALAAASRRFRDRECVAKLRQAGSADAILALLEGEDEARDAA